VWSKNLLTLEAALLKLERQVTFALQCISNWEGEGGAGRGNGAKTVTRGVEKQLRRADF
jgi:hypothetical protein